MPANYQKAGLNFMYPENWTVADDTEGIPRTISLQAPTGAFWSIDIHPFSVDVEMLLDQIIDAMKTDTTIWKPLGRTEKPWASRRLATTWRSTVWIF